MADAHKSRISMQHAANTLTTSTLCVSLHVLHAPGTQSSQMSFTPAPGNPGPWVQQRKKQSRPRAMTSPPPPPPVFVIYTRNRFAPLRETERGAVIVGDSIVRHADATLAEGKVTLKRDFRSLIETVHSTSLATTIMVSGPLPTY